MSWRVEHGNCIAAMAAMDAASVDAIVCDPPYGLEFMGKSWDRFKPSDAKLRTRIDGRTNGAEKSSVTTPEAYRAGRPFQVWCEEWATEALRVLKPGGHLLAFGGTRTSHRLVSGVEDAGFEIRDTIAWMYGSGFPKSLDVSKAIDKAAGAEREVVGQYHHPATGKPHGNFASDGNRTAIGDFSMCDDTRCITAPATAPATAWQGWGTALKPAHEPIVVARKPLAGTVAANVLARGTGAINVAGCRIAVDDAAYARNHSGDRGHDGTRSIEERGSTDLRPGGGSASDAGRWPANVVLDSEAAMMLDEQTGELRSGKLTADNQLRGGYAGERGGTIYGTSERGGLGEYEASVGGASRFFYCAKADNAERNAGLGADAGLFATGDEPDRNDHPTVKPIDLMRWLVRLVTPPGGVVLDPFAGSGTTGCAAVLEGFDFIGVEGQEPYVAICRARIAYWSTGRSEAA